MGRSFVSRAARKAVRVVSTAAHSVERAVSNVAHAVEHTVSNIAHEAEHVVHNIVHESANAVRKVNDEVNPYRKAHLQRDKSIADNLAELTRQFETQKQHLTKEITELRASLNTAKANINEQKQLIITKQIETLKSEIEHLAIFDAAIENCMNRKSGIVALKQLLTYLENGEQHLVDAFMTCNPLGLAMIFNCRSAVNFIYTNFAKFIKPDAASIIGLSLVESLKYVTASDYIQMVKSIQRTQDSNDNLQIVNCNLADNNESKSTIFSIIKHFGIISLAYYRKSYLVDELKIKVAKVLPEYKQNCNVIFASAIPTVELTVNEDATNKILLIDIELERLDDIHASELDKIKADYEKNHHEIYNAIKTQAKLNKRKIHKSLAVTVTSIAAGGWMAPHVAIAIGVNPVSGASVAMLRGALTYGTSSAINREFSIKDLAKTVATAGVTEVVTAQILKLEIIPLNKEFVAGFSSGVVGSVIYGDTKHALTHGLLGGTIQYSSTAVAARITPISKESSRVKTSINAFTKGLIFASMMVAASYVVLKRTKDFSMVLLSAIGSLLHHIAQAEAERLDAEHKAKQEEIKRREIRESRKQAKLQEAKLQEAKLQEAKLQEAKLQEAKLQEAKLQEAKLQEAKLQEAKLQEAKLQEAKLQEAKLQEAKAKAALKETPVPVIIANTYEPEVDFSNRPVSLLADLSDEYMVTNAVAPEPKVAFKSNIKSSKRNNNSPIVHTSDVSHLKNGANKISDLNSRSKQTQTLANKTQNNSTLLKTENSFIHSLKMAGKAVAGKIDSEVIAWQKNNRIKAPTFAAFTDGVRRSDIVLMVDSFSEQALNAAKAPVQFVAEETARFNIGEQTISGQVLKTVGTFVGEDSARFDLGERTKTREFFNDFTSFVGSDFKKVFTGQETVTGRAIVDDLQYIASLNRIELAGYFGRELTTAAMLYGAGRGLQMVGKAAGPVVGFNKAATPNNMKLIPTNKSANAKTKIPADPAKATQSQVKPITFSQRAKALDDKSVLAYPKPPEPKKKLTKEQILEYLKDVHNKPMAQLAKDFEKIGLELYEPPKDGIYKFLHWRTDIRREHALRKTKDLIQKYEKPKIENCKFIIEVHKGKGGLDLDHMHITDVHGNVYDKHLNNLTAKFRKENPSLHENQIKDRVESLPDAHIKIKEFAKLNMGLKNV